MGPFFPQKSTVFQRFSVLALLVTVLITSGCVRRRFTVRTNPPGAVLYVDNQEIGVTPVATGYTYYGTREIRLEKDGYEPVVQLHQFKTPWYEYPGLDFISENIVPWEIRDQRDLEFEMVPRRIIPPEELRARAEQLRANAQAGFVTPLAPPQQTYVPSAVVQPPAQRIPYWDDLNQPQAQPTPAEMLPAPPSSGMNSLPSGGYELPPLPAGY
ncbi:PEGA domain-containing protein [Blastopirellula marina]|uniref:PEGA domain-containing protein n=1 Tax=Blastopirellula marina TaxID=124 RepID=UPI001E534F88|nr:PEGA domain-containing protein [Blastopirellula marina]